MVCNFVFTALLDCLQCFDAIGWAAGRASGGVLVWLSVWSKVQIGFTFLVPAHSGSPAPGQRAVKRVCVRACVLSVTLPNLDRFVQFLFSRLNSQQQQRPFNGL